jgi:dephospho-CoA kinase
MMSESSIGGGSKPVIGLVGGVGSGKSAAARLFGQKGCVVLDADRIGHRILSRPSARRAVVEEFGEEILAETGGVDRKKLGRLVFGDAGKLERLGRIMWPRIRRSLRRGIVRGRRDASVPAVVLDAAVLLEAGWDSLCTDLVFVDASPSSRRRRATSRSGWSERDWRRRENSQIALDRKASACSYRIGNDSDIPHLREQVCEVFHRITRH